MEKLLTLLQLSHKRPDVVSFMKKYVSVLLIVSVAYVFVMAAKGADYDSEYQGIYHWGAEVNTFSPCDSEMTYWVSGSSWVLKPLYNFVKDETKSPYEPVYIEFRGHLLDEKLDGFATEYDGLIRISELRLKSLKIPQQCGDYFRRE